MKGSLETKESDWDRLKKAISGEEVIEVKLMLDQTPNIANVIDADSTTALHHAATTGNEDIILMLLTRMSKQIIHTADKTGKIPLHYAARSGKESAVKTLIEFSPKSINIIDNEANTALHSATQSYQLGVPKLIISLLLKANPELIHSTNKIGKTALYLAVENGNSSAVGYLLEANNKFFDDLDKIGKTVLHCAVERAIGTKAGTKVSSKIEILQRLLTANPKSSEIVDKTGNTVLHYAAEKGDELMTRMLLKVQPALIYILDSNGKTAAHRAAYNGFSQLARKLSEAESKTINPYLNQEIVSKLDKDSICTPEKIHKLLLAQLQKEKNINVEITILQNVTKTFATEQQLKASLESAIGGNKVLIIALQLHQSAWAGLILKHLGDNNLQLIYTDPTGNAYTKEPIAQNLVNSLVELNHQGDTNITDLRQTQQNNESNSLTIVIDSLVKLSMTKSLKKADLQKLLFQSQDVNELKIKHLLLMEEKSLEYSQYKVKKLLDLFLKDCSVNIAQVGSFEEKSLLIENIKMIVRQVMDSGIPAIMPLFIKSEQWSGIVLKKLQDGSLQVIYNNPLGDPLGLEKNAKSLIAAIIEVNPEVHIFDLRYRQGDNKQSSGVLTVNNLTKLVLSETGDFHRDDFQKLLLLTTNVDGLRIKHTQTIDGYIIPSLISVSELPILEMRREDEAFEQKEDKLEENGKYTISPPAYEEDPLIQIHVLGEATEPYSKELDNIY